MAFPVTVLIQRQKEGRSWRMKSLLYFIVLCEDGEKVGAYSIKRER